MRLPRLQFGLLGMLGLIALVAVLLGLARQIGRDSLLFIPSVVLASLASRPGAEPGHALAFSFLLGVIGGVLAISIALAIQGGGPRSGLPVLFGAVGGLIGLITRMGIQTFRCLRKLGRS